MNIYRKTIMNGTELTQIPFRREFELEGCLSYTPELLGLDDGEYAFSKLIAVEKFIKNGRGKSDGRADMLVLYKGGQVGIVELKRDDVTVKAYNQLESYLAARDGINDVKGFKDFKETEGNDEFNSDNDNSFVGVLVGNCIAKEVVEKIRKRKETPLIYAIELKRYNNTIGDDFIFTKVFSPCGRDYTKYQVNGRGCFGKGRMVLEVIRQYVSAKQPSYEQLEKVFPPKLRGVKKKGYGCFDRVEVAKGLAERSGYVRHYIKDNEVLALRDCDVAVSTEWGIGNISEFIGIAKKLGFNVSKKPKGNKQ